MHPANGFLVDPESAAQYHDKNVPKRIQRGIFFAFMPPDA
jgi:hypothetical protein